MAIPALYLEPIELVLAEQRHLRIEWNRFRVEPGCPTVAGGQGVVQQGILDNTRVVAIKELRSIMTGGNQERLRGACRLARELRVWAGLDHPNILELIGFCIEPDLTGARLIAPWFDNGHVVDYIDTFHPTMLQRLLLVAGATHGLEYLHSCGITHGDIKPTNVLIGNSGEPVLCDFGLSQLLANKGRRSGLTTSKTFKGSLRFMSPELVNDEGPSCTFASDIWAWGCLLYQILSDVVPYARIRKDVRVILELALCHPPADLEDIALPLGLGDLLRHCWTAEWELRPNIDECVTVLSAAIECIRMQDHPTTEEYPDSMNSSVMTLSRDNLRQHLHACRDRGTKSSGGSSVSSAPSFEIVVTPDGSDDGNSPWITSMELMSTDDLNFRNPSTIPSKHTEDGSSDWVPALSST